MGKRSVYFISSIFVFILFVVFSYLVSTSTLNQFDFDIAVKIQDNISHKIDYYFSILSLSGTIEVYLFILFLIIALRRKLRGLLTIAIFMGIHVIELMGKALLYHPGPPFKFFRYNLDLFFPSAYIKPGSSYPSGHSMRAAFIAVFLLFLIFKNKKMSLTSKSLLSIPVVFFSVGMFISRISLGEHWTERLRQQPKPYVLGETEIIKGRKTRFELLLVDSHNQALQNLDHRIEGLNTDDLTWNVDKDKIFFYSPFSEGVLVCDIKRDKRRRVKIQDGGEEFTAFTVGTHADSWFNNIANTTSLKVVARQVPNLL